jgi:hypothetical protein
MSIGPQFNAKQWDFGSSFIYQHVVVFYYHTCFMVLGPTLSSDDSPYVLTLCS